MFLLLLKAILVCEKEKKEKTKPPAKNTEVPKKSKLDNDAKAEDATTRMNKTRGITRKPLGSFHKDEMDKSVEKASPEKTHNALSMKGVRMTMFISNSL
jgi:hypothetical protein